jgi:hypothetical protein
MLNLWAFYKTLKNFLLLIIQATYTNTSLANNGIHIHIFVFLQEKNKNNFMRKISNLTKMIY